MYILYQTKIWKLMFSLWPEFISLIKKPVSSYQIHVILRRFFFYLVIYIITPMKWLQIIYLLLCFIRAENVTNMQTTMPTHHVLFVKPISKLIELSNIKGPTYNRQIYVEFNENFDKQEVNINTHACAYHTGGIINQHRSWILNYLYWFTTNKLCFLLIKGPVHRKTINGSHCWYW